jgi:hypothetical protein
MLNILFYLFLENESKTNYHPFTFFHQLKKVTKKAAASPASLRFFFIALQALKLLTPYSRSSNSKACLTLHFAKSLNAHQLRREIRISNNNAYSFVW